MLQQSMQEYLKYCGIPDQKMWPMILEELDAAEKELALEDWQYLYKNSYGPEKKRIHDMIVELGGEI